MSQRRTAKIDGELQRLLGEIFLTEMKDPRFSKMAGVTRVAVTPDLKYAKVYISIYDTPARVESTMEALRSAEPFLRADCAGSPTWSLCTILRLPIASKYPSSSMR